jgi:hypothetical protein
MAILRSLLKSLGLGGLRTDQDDAAPSRIAIMSGGVITLSLVLLLLVV